MTFIAAVILGFVGYVLGAAMTGNVIGALLFAVVGFVLGAALAAWAGSRRRAGRPTGRSANVE